MFLLPSTQGKVCDFFDGLAILAAREVIAAEPLLDRTAADLVSGWDSSHSITHLRNTWWLARTLSSREGLTKEDEEVATISALLHDCLDHKYLTPEEAEVNAKVLRAALEARPLAQTQIAKVFRVISHISFSVRRARIAQGLVEFPEDLERVCQVTSDADLLEAYDPRRVLTYQLHHQPTLELQRRWAKTIFESRILKYESLWVRTQTAKTLARDLHTKLLDWVNEPEQTSWWQTVEEVDY